MVQIKELTFGYRKKQLLFDHLNLTLERGKIYGLFGVNGAGKTTLIRHIAGLLFPQQGIILVEGYDATKRHVEMLQNLFVIPEEFSLPSLTASAYVQLHEGFYPKFSRSVFEAVMTEFEVNPMMKLDALSYGQKKKFMIAFGIASNCGLLLMDEPTNGLDIPSKSQFRKIMATHITDDRCVLISTHQVRDLASMIDHVIILDNGNIRFMASTEQITDSLSFGLITSTEEHEIVYSEEVFGGKAAITRNRGKHTEIDFELLFNGVIRDANSINNALKGGVQ